MLSSASINIDGRIIEQLDSLKGGQDHRNALEYAYYDRLRGQGVAYLMVGFDGTS